MPCQTPETFELPLNCPNSLSDLSPESTASLAAETFPVVLPKVVQASSEPPPT